MAEPGFAERVRVSGVRLTSRSPCLDVVRILASGMLPRLRGLRIEWHQLWNPARASALVCKGEWGRLCCMCAVANNRILDETTYADWTAIPADGSPARTMKDLPRTTISIHTLPQCYSLRQQAKKQAQEQPEACGWMLIELDPFLVVRMLVAAMVYQERQSA